MKYLLIDANSLILAVASQPITLGADKVTNLDNGDVIFEPGSDFTTEEVQDADIPPRFTSRKYMWDGEAITTNPDWIEPQPIPTPTVKTPQISRIRFDAVFAGAIGDLAYETVLVAVQTVAATNPMTDDSAKVRRAWRALNSVSTVDYPLGPWRDANLDDANGDLTGQFLKLIAAILVEDIPDIADKIDAGLAAWPEI